MSNEIKKTGLIIKDLEPPIRKLADQYANEWEARRKIIKPFGAEENPYKNLKFEDADLQLAFNWGATKEGRRFWSTFYNKYKMIYEKINDNLYLTTYHDRVLLKTENGTYICGYNHEPTANCQMASLSEASHSLATKQNNVLLFEYLIKGWRTPALKNIVLMDINYEHVKTAEKILTKYNVPIISKQGYKSTNSSEMVIYLLNMRDKK